MLAVGRVQLRGTCCGDAAFDRRQECMRHPLLVGLGHLCADVGFERGQQFGVLLIDVIQRSHMAAQIVVRQAAGMAPVFRKRPIAIGRLHAEREADAQLEILFYLNPLTSRINAVGA